MGRMWVEGALPSPGYATADSNLRGVPRNRNVFCFVGDYEKEQ